MITKSLVEYQLFLLFLTKQGVTCSWEYSLKELWQNVRDFWRNQNLIAETNKQTTVELCLKQQIDLLNKQLDTERIKLKKPKQAMPNSQTQL